MTTPLPRLAVEYKTYMLAPPCLALPCLPAAESLPQHLLLMFLHSSSYLLLSISLLCSSSHPHTYVSLYFTFLLPTLCLICTVPFHLTILTHPSLPFSFSLHFSRLFYFYILYLHFPQSFSFCLHNQASFSTTFLKTSFHNYTPPSSPRHLPCLYTSYDCVASVFCT